MIKLSTCVNNWHKGFRYPSEGKLIIESKIKYLLYFILFAD